MHIACQSCGKGYVIDDEKIPKKSVRIRCKNCDAFLVISGVNPLSAFPLAPERTLHEEAAAENVPASSTSESTIKTATHPLHSEKKKFIPSGWSLQNEVSPSRTSKIRLSAIILFVLFTIQCHSVHSVVYENALFRCLDTSAESHIDSALKRAAATYAIARSINAGISVVKSSQLSIAPAGVGIAVTFGEILDPVDDLVERFSWVMLASMISLGIQKVLVYVGPWLSLYVFLTCGLICALVAIWAKNRTKAVFTGIAKKACFAALVVRFSLPLVGYLNQQTYVYFLESHYESAATDIRNDEAAIRNAANEMIDPGEASTSDESIGGKLKSLWRDTKNTLNVKGRLEALRAKCENMADKLIRWSVVFLLTTIIFPIAYLWGFMNFSRFLLNDSFAAGVEHSLRTKISATGKKFMQDMPQKNLPGAAIP
jgi:predicted Zn finger-like uncharacterized protein